MIGNKSLTQNVTSSAQQGNEEEIAKEQYFENSWNITVGFRNTNENPWKAVIKIQRRTLDTSRHRPGFQRWWMAQGQHRGWLRAVRELCPQRPRADSPPRRTLPPTHPSKCWRTRGASNFRSWQSESTSRSSRCCVTADSNTQPFEKIDCLRHFPNLCLPF